MAKKHFNTDVKKNLKAAFQTDELIDYGIAAGGSIALWALVPSVLKKFAPDIASGWTGYAIAFILNFGAGALFGNAALCHSAFALAGVHLLYSKGSGFMTNTMGLPLWRMGGDYATADAAASLPTTTTAPPTITTPGTTQGLRGYDNDNAETVLMSANGKNWASRSAPALSDQIEAMPGSLDGYQTEGRSMMGLGQIDKLSSTNAQDQLTNYMTSNSSFIYKQPANQMANINTQGASWANRSMW